MRYKIKESSPWLFSVTMITVFFSSFALFILLDSFKIVPNLHDFVIIAYFASSIGFAYYLTRFTAVAEIELVIDEEGVNRKWLRQFIFHNKRDEIFRWSDINDYVFQPERQFDHFKLQFKNGTEFKLYHDSSHDEKDDFRQFLADFAQKVEQINNFDNNQRNAITLGHTIYETTWGLISAILAVVFIIGLPILFFILYQNGNIKLNKYLYLLAPYFGAVYYVSEVYSHRKKKKELEDNVNDGS
jgi:hypothetical protein